MLSFLAFAVSSEADHCVAELGIAFLHALHYLLYHSLDKYTVVAATNPITAHLRQNSHPSS